MDATLDEPSRPAEPRRTSLRPRPPLRLSRYLLLRPLGSGGAGVVYDAYDPELARRVAIKVLRPARRDSEGSARARARFVREAQSIARLSHPNVIAVHDVGTYAASELEPEARAELGKPGGGDDGVFIVMEVVDGPDVSTWIEQGPRTWRQVLDVFIAAGRGLAAAHAAGIVHRDFKPGNVLVGRDGRVKVVDFGLALTYGMTDSDVSGPHLDSSITGRVLERLAPVAVIDPLPAGDDADRPEGQVSADRLTRTGALLGTPAYMAPEQHRGEAADQKADQFAFCASLFRAMYGRHPYSSRTVEGLVVAKMSHRVTTTSGSKVPAWVRRILLRGMSPQSSARFPDMTALLTALENDPGRRLLRWTRAAAVPIAIAAVAYAVVSAMRPGAVTVHVQSRGQKVAGAHVDVDDEGLTIDGEYARGEVAPGIHRLRVTAPDHLPHETIVEVQRGGTHEVRVDLVHEQGAFDLEVDPPGGSVFVDGVDYGSRLKNLPVDTGAHEILIRHEGHEDVRLSWSALPGEVTSGFVSLRRALVWSEPRSGTNARVDWLGDATGDGRQDVLMRYFNRVEAHDPFHARTLWRLELRPVAAMETCDADLDGVEDLVTLEWEAKETRLAVHSGLADPQRRPQLLWQHTWPAPPADLDLGIGGVACRVRDDGTRDVLVSGAAAADVEAFAGRDGTPRFVAALADPPMALAGIREGALVLGTDAVVSLDEDGAQRWRTALAIEPADEEGRARFRAEVTRLRTAGADMMVPLSNRVGTTVGIAALIGDPRAPQLVGLGGDDGLEHWRSPVSSFVNALGPGSRLDVDGDGVDDLLVRGTALSVVSGRTGQSRWRLAMPAGARARLLGLRPLPAVAMVEGASLRLHDAASGVTLAERTLDGTATSEPVPADWNGDGRPDLAIGVRSGFVQAFDEGLRPLGTVPLSVGPAWIDASRDGDGDGFPDLLIESLGPAILVGPKTRWRRAYQDAVRATPVAGDLDGDGSVELVVLGRRESVEQLDVLAAGDGALLRARAMPAKVIRAPALRRVGTVQELLLAGDGLLRLHGPTLEELARVPLAEGYASPTVGDLDLDGREEVVVVSWDGAHRVDVFDAQSLSLVRSYDLSTGSFGAPLLEDLDRDGRPEIVLALLDGTVIALGPREPRWHTPTGGRLNFAPAIGDLDGDGSPELVVTPHVDSDDVVVLGADGSLRARWPGLGSRRSRPVLHDADADGRPEIYVGSRERGLLRLDDEGNVQWTYRFVDADGLQPPIAGPLTLADLEGDGRAEVLAGFEDGSVHVVDTISGTRVWAFFTGGGDIEAAPVAIDVDLDGRQEVVVGAHDRQLYCLRHLPPRR